MSHAMWRALTVLGVFLWAVAAHGAATVESVRGDVRAGATQSAMARVGEGQTVTNGQVVATGSGGRATLRFTDGSTVALHENTEFRIADYAFAPDNPAGDRSRFELIKGTLRAVTAALGARSPQAYSIRTSLATAGVRGTDFMLSVVNPLYFQILNGSVSVVNSAGAPVFSAGAIGTASADGALALTVAPSTLPAGVLQAFNQLAALNLASLAPALGPATPSVVPAGFGATVVPGAILIGIGVAAAAGEEDRGIAASTATGTATGTR